MLTDLPIELNGWEPVSESLAEIHTVHEESSRFLSEWFARVESLLSDLLRNPEQWQGVNDRPLGEDAPWSMLLDQLSQVRGQMAETRAEVQRLAEPLESAIREVPDSQTNERLQAEIDALRREHETLREERVLLESELDNIRHRDAELTEALEKQERAKGEQELYWREEFRRQCVLVERLTSKLVQSTLGGQAVEASTPHHENEKDLEVEDLALESVRAQFDLLQGEAMRRRKENTSVH